MRVSERSRAYLNKYLLSEHGGDVLKKVENVKECEEKEFVLWRWKQELNSVVIKLNSVKEIIKRGAR
jgi:hypothetical protein